MNENMQIMTAFSDGVLAKAGQPRQPQIDMAEAVMHAIQDQTQLVVEAETELEKLSHI